MSKNGRTAVAIPALDAARSIGEVVRRTRAVIEHVLVVDDGSHDATAAEALTAGASLVRHAKNLGKGRALRTAFDELFKDGFENVVTLDADGQHLPEEIPRLLEAGCAGADLVIGCRDHLFARMHRLRRASNRWSTRAISLAAGRPLADAQSGFRLYTRRLVEKTGFPETRFEAESAVLVRAARRGLDIRWVPIQLGFVDGRCTSHYRPLIDSLRIAEAVLRARFTTSTR